MLTMRPALVARKASTSNAFELSTTSSPSRLRIRRDVSISKLSKQIFPFDSWLTAVSRFYQNLPSDLRLFTPFGASLSTVKIKQRTKLSIVTYEVTVVRVEDGRTPVKEEGGGNKTIQGRLDRIRDIRRLFKRGRRSPQS